MAHLLVQNLPKASMTKTLVQAFVEFNKACATASTLTIQLCCKASMVFNVTFVQALAA